jgi:hypothetical protein
MVKEKLEAISKSESARRWSVSPAAVQKYIAKGMPVREDGKLDWPAVDVWRQRSSAPSKSGSWKARTFATERAAGQSADFNAGAAWMAEQLCAATRRQLPKFLSETPMTSIPENQRPGVKALFATIFVFLIEGWSEVYIDAGKLPPVDWKCFGADAAAVRRESEELIAEWRAARSSGLMG